MNTETNINNELKELGFSIKSAILLEDTFDGRKGNHKWHVILKYNKTHYTTEYTTGAAYRVDKRGKQIVIPWNGRMTIYEQQQLIRNTRPQKPILSDVVSCLLTDASVLEECDFNIDTYADLFGGGQKFRQIRESFEACQKAYAFVRQLPREKLDNLFQDY